MRTKPIVATLFVISLIVAAVVLTHMASQKGDAGAPKAQILVTTVQWRPTPNLTVGHGPVFTARFCVMN